jgi:hypothetical protein
VRVGAAFVGRRLAMCHSPAQNFDKSASSHDDVAEKDMCSSCCSICPDRGLFLFVQVIG